MEHTLVAEAFGKFQQKRCWEGDTLWGRFFTVNKMTIDFSPMFRVNLPIFIKGAVEIRHLLTVISKKCEKKYRFYVK